MSRLTLFTLHSSIVACLLEVDVSQVQDSCHDPEHHGTVLRRDADHFHGLLGEQRKSACLIRTTVDYSVYSLLQHLALVL